MGTLSGSAEGLRADQGDTSVLSGPEGIPKDFVTLSSDFSPALFPTTLYESGYTVVTRAPGANVQTWIRSGRSARPTVW